MKAPLHSIESVEGSFAVPGRRCRLRASIDCSPKPSPPHIGAGGGDGRERLGEVLDHRTRILAGDVDVFETLRFVQRAGRRVVRIHP